MARTLLAVMTALVRELLPIEQLDQVRRKWSVLPWWGVALSSSR
jgi:hypothetical protein